MSVLEARDYITYLAKILYASQNRTFEEGWGKEKKYSFRFVSTDGLTGSWVRRIECFKSPEDIETQLRILKSVWALLHTTSYTQFKAEPKHLLIEGVQSGKGVFWVDIKEDRRLKITVMTITARNSA